VVGTIQLNGFGDIKINMKTKILIILLSIILLSCESQNQVSSIRNRTVFVDFGVNNHEVVPSENSPFDSYKIEDRVFFTGRFLHIVFRFYWNPTTSETIETIQLSARFPKQETIVSFFQYGNQAPLIVRGEDEMIYTFFLVPNDMNGYVFTLLPQVEMDYQITLTSTFELTGKGNSMPVLTFRDE
jgi:uncharacterized protein YcfL